jgi:hypothetical protein
MTSNPRIDRLEGEVRQMSERTTSLENSIHSLRSEMNSRFNALESRMTTLWVSTMGTIIAGVIALVVAILLRS